MARFVELAGTDQDHFPSAVFHIQRASNGDWFVECDSWTYSNENPNAPLPLAVRWAKESSPSGESARARWLQYLLEAEYYDSHAAQVWDISGVPAHEAPADELTEDMADNEIPF
ncbi:MAG: hypothetical protein KKC70_04585 [Gammaproteobacteria bacterium]|nr:hypothetical protein [Gammaproteobacteria bacterium]